MKVRKLLEIQSTFEDRKVPCDMNGELNKHYSESKGEHIDILDMDLIHLVRSYSKTIGKKYNYIDTENKEIMREKLDIILQETYNAREIIDKNEK